MSAVLPTLDLFGAPTAPPQIVRLDRSTDRERPCCRNLAIVLPRPDTPHAAELRCEDCNRHRGWLPQEAMKFLVEIAKRFGAPTDPPVLRDQTIGDHHMQKPQRDLAGILFKNSSKGNPSQPDYRGEAMVNNVPYKLSAWIKQAKTGEKFMSLAFTPEDAAKPAAKAAPANDFHSDEVPF